MIVCFLDILGFSTLVKKNPTKAFNKISYLNDFIKTKYFDVMNLNNCGQNQNGYLQNIKDLIFISDSIIITGDENNYNFYNDLAFFIGDSFMETSKDVVNKRTIIKSKLDDYCLFRTGCGLSKNEIVIDSYAIVNSKIKNTLSVFGQGYINAYHNESLCKGPVVLIEASDYNQLSPNIQNLFKSHQVPFNNSNGSSTQVTYYEFLWPYFIIDHGNITINGKKDYNANLENFNKSFLQKTLLICEEYINDSQSIKEQYKSFCSILIESLNLYKSKMPNDCDMGYIDSLIQTTNNTYNKLYN